MLGHFPKQLADTDPAALIPWLKDTVLRPEDALTTDIQVRLRGNILHVLCESAEVGLPRDYVLMRLVRSLMNPDVQQRFASEFPQIYQIYVYSRQALERKPVWSAPIYLNRLERHLDRLVQSGAGGVEAAALLSRSTPTAPEESTFHQETVETETIETADISAFESTATADTATAGRAPSDQPSNQFAAEISTAEISDAKISDAEISERAASVEQISDVILARQGDSSAIARYLSQTLSALNVGVKVNARVVPGKARTARSAAGPTPIDLRDRDLRDRDLHDQASADRASTEDGESNQDAGGSADTELASRLWVFCEASYSPDPLLIAEPIAERLRQLHLRQFQDAVITIQVTGEASSDWRLRVDLTPPETMLRAWAQWGDVPALGHLANQISGPHGLKLIAEVKKTTLHLISYPLTPVSLPATSDAISESDAQAAYIEDGLGGLGGRQSEFKDDLTGSHLPGPLNVDALVADIKTMLCAIAPQGLHRAMLYGPSTDDISPEWLRGIDLPAAEENSPLAASTNTLATHGNLPALAYCLTRALNPDIEEQLATGGIRVQLLKKDKLLHVMADGPVCPSKHGIVPLINQTLKQVDVPDLEGIRLYGRRAGQKQPIWTYGTDYTPRQRLVPEAKPEFAASESYIGELITPVSDESLAETDTHESESDLKLGSLLVRAIQFVLVKSQLFAPAEEKERLALPSNHAASAGFQAEGGKMALIFGAVGLLLAIQFDFMVGRALRQAAEPVTKSVAVAEARTGADSESDSDSVGRIRTRNTFDEDLAELDWESAQADENWPADSWETEEEEADSWNNEEDGWASDTWSESENDGNGTRFDSRDFTASAIADDELIYSPQQEYVSTATLLAGSTLPTFRSQQLDEKIALYRRRVAQSGPPDVLVIGSSRALRGVDPAALRQSLDQSGNEGLSVFNFGVNGATAQVVDLIVRRLIPPDQLPQIIVWADGARAFNSGRTDVTFNAIASSEGYKQLEASESADGINDLAIGSLADQLSIQAKATDRQMSEVFGQLSSAYEHRGTLRAALSQGFGALSPDFLTETGTTRAGDTPTELPTETSLIDFDGFLALSTQFNPATYYQDHARVAGAYDGDYKDFQMEGKQADALNNLLYFTAQKEVPIVFINTPLTDEYLDNRRSKAEEDFLQFMLQRAERSSSMTFRDFGRLWPQRYDYFSDPSHLNRYGAYQVSQRLAQDPLISWPQPLPTTTDR